MQRERRLVAIGCQFNWIVRDVWLLQWQLVKT